MAILMRPSPENTPLTHAPDPQYNLVTNKEITMINIKGKTAYVWIAAVAAFIIIGILAN